MEIQKLNLRVKLFITCVILAVHFANADAKGLECYECEELSEDIIQLPELMGSRSRKGHSNCSYIIQNQLVTLCKPLGSLCLTFSGKTLKDKYFEKRICGHIGTAIKIGSDECKPLMDMGPGVTDHYNYDPLSQPLSAESIILCTCSTDRCNNATQIHSSPASTATTLEYYPLLGSCVSILTGLFFWFPSFL